MAKYLQHHTVVRDGFHNMLTSMVFWRDYYWLAYRRVSGHYEPDGGVVILRSVDLKRWHNVAQITSVGCDWSPKFCATKNRLFVYFYTTYPLLEGLRTKAGDLITPSKEKVDRDTHVSFTDNGISWSEPKAVWKNQWNFGVCTYKNTFYMTAYGCQGDAHEHIHGPLDLLKSQDGINWKKMVTIAGVEDRVNEADLFFHEDGEVWVISSTWRKPQNQSLFFASKPPYQKWERFELNVRIHSPCFCKSGDTLYVAGRRWMDEPWVQSAPTYNQDKYPIDYIEPTLVGNSAIWTVEKGKVTPFFAVPAIGDHWQPSLISREPGKLIISYNSQHAYLTGTMTSTIPMPSSGLRPDVFLADDDIYVAEIEVT